VLVVNHCSYTDSLLLAATLPTPHCFVAKFELQTWPIVQRYLQQLGTVFITRTAPERSAAELGQLVGTLARGDSLAVFPEGTFTRAAGLRAFHLGAFEAAIAANAAVIPVALQGTRSLLRDGQWLPRRMPVRITIGSPLRAPANADTFAAAVWLRDATRAEILRHNGEPEL